MMIKMRKKVQTAAALFLALGMLASCSKTADAPSGGQLNTGNGTVTTGGLTLPIVSEPVEITFWMPLGAKQAAMCKDMGEMPPFQELERRTGIKIKWTNPPSAVAAEQLNLLIASRDFPDIIYTGWSDLGKYTDDNVIIPLTEMLKEDSPNLSKVLDGYPDIRKQLTAADGNIYYYPRIRVPWDGKIDWASALPRLAIRQDWLDKVDKKMPTTLDEWHDVLTAFKNYDDLNGTNMKNEVMFTAMKFNADGNSGLLGVDDLLIWPYGIMSAFHQRDGEVMYGMILPEFKEAMDMIAEWYKEGLIDKDFLIHDEAQIEAKLFNGQIGALQAYSARYFRRAMENFEQKGLDYKYSIAPFPKPMDGSQKPYHFQQQLIAYLVGRSGAAISTTNKYRRESVRMLDYLYSPEGMELATYGIEGESYEVVEDPKGDYYRFTLDKLAKEVNNTSEAVQGKYVLAYDAFPCISLPYYGSEWYKTAELPAMSTPDEFDPQRKLMEHYGWDYSIVDEDWKDWNTSRILPPLFFTSMESDTIRRKMTDINTYASDQVTKWIMGVESTSNFDDFVAKLTEMGLLEVKAVYQDALDRYNTVK